ncbi:hypothetical protein [Actinacidiphila sp. bgisy167]|uniref:hypothetical protein n=1 Tax=Actinacidiphila sp. bgisy167 TaxID=3413797 RepID=UPI003D73C19E
MVAQHVAGMVAHLTRMIKDGVAAGDFFADDPEAAAQAVWDATCRFHDPAYAAEWAAPGIDAAFRAVSDLVLRGLEA